MGTTSHNLTTGRTQTMMPSQLPGSSDLRVHACQYLSFEAGAYGTSRVTRHRPHRSSEISLPPKCTRETRWPSRRAWSLWALPGGMLQIGDKDIEQGDR